MKTYFVVGLGRFGYETARALSAMGCEVLAMDVYNDVVQAISAEVTHAVVGDSRDKDVLKALDVADCDCAVVAIGNDLAASVLTVMNLQELGVQEIICKAHDEAHRRVLEKLGATRVVIPEKEYATRLAKSLASTNVLDYIELSQDCGIVEVPAPEVWHGKTLVELQVRAKLGINIIAIRSGGSINVSPAANYTVQAGDVMVMVGDNNAISRVQKL
jgi:trk system potassium uptake protein TrkA